MRAPHELNASGAAAAGGRLCSAPMEAALFEWLYPALVVALGYVVLGLTGFASSLIAVPLLAWYWPLAEVVPLALVMDMLGSLLMGGLNLREVRWAEFRALAPGMMLGCAGGMWLAGWLASAWPLLGLGAYVAWVGLRALRLARRQVLPVAQPAPVSARLAWLYGTSIGLVVMLFATGGPLVLAWLVRRRLDTRALRASLPVIIMLAALVALLLMVVDGRLFDVLLWQRLLVLLPIALVGVVVGHRVAHRVPVERLRLLIYSLLAASGLLLMLNAVNRML